MEPFEWLLLGVGFLVGNLVGSRGKGLVKSAAKGYLIVEEKTKEWTANLREDFNDAVEEARYEREQEMSLREEAGTPAALEEEPVEQAAPAAAKSPSRSRATRATGARSTGKGRASSGRKRAGAEPSATATRTEGPSAGAGEGGTPEPA